MLNSLSSILLQECELIPLKPIIVGVSGGPDSLCLLEILMREGFSVVIYHLDHQLRAESKEEAEFVKKLAQKKGVPFVGEKADVGKYANEGKKSLEEAARIIRYQRMFQVAKQYEAQAVAVGHNADDQVETVLMHFLRGTGLEGLQGMQYRLLPNPWSRTIPLVRPLLGVWREEIEAFLSHQELNPVIDNSNSDKTFMRNRIRHELIPFLNSYVPNIKKRIWQQASGYKDDYAFINDHVSLLWGKILREETEDYLVLSSADLLNIQKGLRNHLLRRAIKTLVSGATSDINFQVISRLDNFIEKPTRSGKDNIGLGLWAILIGDDLILSSMREITYLSDSFPQMIEEETVKLSLPGKVSLSNQWVIDARLVEESQHPRENLYENKNRFRAWLGFKEEPKHLIIRTRQPGDRFPPLGMGGKTVSIKKYMINRKIPSIVRERFPLVCANDEIAWLPGYQISESFKVTSRTGIVLEVTLTRIPE